VYKGTGVLGVNYQKLNPTLTYVFSCVVFAFS